MIKIITAINNPYLNEELKEENNIEIICKDIQYKEGILEILEYKKEINYIIIDENLPGEIKLEKLIEKIFENNEEIKIIILIKKENKEIIKDLNFLNDKNIIKIYYEDEINLYKLKNYKNNLENIKKEKNILNIKNKLNKNKIILNKKQTKIITIFGEEKVGKSMTIINLGYYLSSKNCKILLVELNKESPNMKIILERTEVNIKTKKDKIKIKNIYKKVIGKYKQKYINEKIIKKMIKKINKNIDLISYNKLLNFKIINKLKNNYNFILIEINSKKINKNILIKSDKNILLLKNNLLGIKNSKKIIEKNKINKLENIKIIINNYNKYSIDENIIKNIFNKYELIGKIKYKEEYENLINTNFRNIKKYEKIIEEDIKNIERKIFE